MRIKNAFVDFYSQTDRKLAFRDIGDLNNLVQTRENLYLSLGIPPSLLEGKEILEFGPGAGHYSVFNALLRPSLYTLVDGVHDILDAAEKRLNKYSECVGTFEFVEALFKDYVSETKYDLVIAESCIPHQTSPGQLFRHISEFVKPGGLILSTTVSGTSYLSEMIRRLVRDILIDPDSDIDRQLAIMCPLIAGHLKALNGVGRSVEEWVLDNIVQPLNKVELFNIPDAVNAIGEEFSFLGSSPQFSQDWLWYKLVDNSRIHVNKNVIDNYYRTNLNLIDHRCMDLRHESAFGKNIEEKCLMLWKQMCLLESKELDSWQPIEDCLEDIYYLVSDGGIDTKIALRESIDWLKDGAPLGVALRHFPEWWGRGQQHISFVRSNLV